MSDSNLRKVHGFSQSQIRTLVTGKICAYCRKEPATMADHLVAMTFENCAKTLGITLDSDENCLPTCGKCHNVKSASERWIPDNMAEVLPHVTFWRNKAFNKKNQRKKVVLTDKTLRILKSIQRFNIRINFCKRKIAQAITQAQKESLESELTRLYSARARIRKEK